MANYQHFREVIEAERYSIEQRENWIKSIGDEIDERERQVAEYQQANREALLLMRVLADYLAAHGPGERAPDDIDVGGDVVSPNVRIIPNGGNDA